MRNKFIEKISKVVRKPDFSFKCYIAALISIILMIIYDIIVSFAQKEPFDEIQGYVETAMLTFCLITIIISLKKGDKTKAEILVGELLAIYLVTNTTYFIEELIEVINKEDIVLDYIYLAIEFLIMSSSIGLFIDHLNKCNDVKREKRSKTINNIMIISILFVILFDLVAIFIYDDIEYTLIFIDEVFYVSFGFSLSFAVLSNEIRRVEGLE